MSRDPEHEGVAVQIKRRPRVYYGWYVLAISMAGGFLAAGLAQVPMGLMLKPISAPSLWSWV